MSAQDEADEIDVEEVREAVVATLEQNAENEESTIRITGNRVSMTREEFVEGVTSITAALAESQIDD